MCSCVCAPALKAFRNSRHSSAAEKISHSSSAAIFWAALNVYPQRPVDLLSRSTLDISFPQEQKIASMEENLCLGNKYWGKKLDQYNIVALSSHFQSCKRIQL